MLVNWLAAEHLDPNRIAQDVLARPSARYAVVDHFFKPETIRRLASDFDRDDLHPGCAGTNYDCTAGAVQRTDFSSRLLTSEAWLRYVHQALAMPYQPPYENIIALRRLRGGAFGTWPHIDDLQGAPKRIAVLLHLGSEWSPSDGCVLQLWTEDESRSDSAPLRSAEWLDRRLGFLETATRLRIELGGPPDPAVTNLRLLDVLPPLPNRAVFLDLREPAVRSVTPGGGRRRDAILQWLR
jgi:hypothetical protein